MLYAISCSTIFFNFSPQTPRRNKTENVKNWFLNNVFQIENYVAKDNKSRLAHVAIN